ncbi:MAG: hypothetical protein ACYCT9_03110 [Leptospirillum sp.]|jgi:phage-related protein
MKVIVWRRSSKKDLQHVFSGPARKEAGYQITGSDGSGSERLEAFVRSRAGVREIRIHAENDYRILYVAGFGETLFISMRSRKRRRRH